MKLKIPTYSYFVAYFLLLMGLYHYKIKTYFYWINIANLKDSVFGFSFSRFLIAVLLLGINLYFLSSIKKTRFSFIVISLFFALLTIPSLIAFTSGDIYPYKLLLYHQALFFTLFLFSKIKIDFSKFPVINKTQSLYLLLAITSIGVLPYLLIYGPHINLKNLALIDVYETRATMSKLSNPYLGYTYSLFTKIIIPLIIAFALELKKKVWVIVGIGYLILFYLFGAHKTAYVALILVLVFYRLSFVKSVNYILKGSIVLIVLFTGLAMVGYDYPWILTFRRVHFIPTLLDISYLDFFKGTPLYWSDSVLGSLIDYPYDIKHTNLIGKTYFNAPDMAANNGLISDGYMNLETWGVAIHIFLVSVYFMILNSLKIPPKYFGLYVLVIFSFISSSTFTVLLTHGGLLLLLISIFILNGKKS